MGLGKIVVLGTGGTIAGTGASPTDSHYVAAQRGVADLLAGLPGALLAGFELVSEQVAQIDSKDMEVAVWQALLRRCAHWLAQPEVQGVVVTHGTDTAGETADLLPSVLTPVKPVGRTCAMRPATAVSGVVLVCAGQIHGAFDVQKLHSWQLDAFSSGEAGPVGRVRQGQLDLWRNWPVASCRFDPVAIEKIATMPAWPRVEIVLSHGAACGATVDALVASDVAARSGAAPVRGLVVAGTGGGTVHQALEAALRRAQAAGVRVLRSSRCALGSASARPEDAFAAAPGLTPVKARLALMLDLLAD